MKSLEYVKEHLEELEKDFFDSRFSKRLMTFLPILEWERYGFEYTGEGEFVPKEWTEENVVEQLKRDTFFGLEKAQDERGISAELMALCVRAWCKVLENGCEMEDWEDGDYHINQFLSVIKHYGWRLDELDG